MIAYSRTRFVPRHWYRVGGLLIACLVLGGTAAAQSRLDRYNVPIGETTVSGISSGAYMAVQFGVAHSSIVKGVAATAGGPYFCAGRDSWAGSNVDAVLARCMQGDPSSPKRDITPDDMASMLATTRAWAHQGSIDSTDNLARQSIWIFHGYNDGIVKKPVSDALYDYYRAFVPSSQIFYKDDLRAAHAQISVSCPAAASVCNRCDATGRSFINECGDATSGPPYDAAGSLLQQFYGTLNARSTSLNGKLIEFSQKDFTQKNGNAVAPLKISMADAGYVYVPADCAAGHSCRLHVAFHGCQQQASAIGKAFVQHAGFNEWGEANRIIVLYPQTVDTVAAPITPFNPQGCWDWWGYNDFSFDAPGHYATRNGLQIAAVFRMVERLAGGSASTETPPSALGTALGAPSLQVGDATSRQVMVRWQHVPGATGYAVYRGTDLGGPFTVKVGGTPATRTSLVDSDLTPSTRYFYVVRAVAAAGTEGAPSSPISVTTAVTPPACDPYFSLAKNHPVTKKNVSTMTTCP